MTTITSGVPTTALNSTTSLWRHSIHKLNSGVRFILWTDGTNLYGETSANGSSWPTTGSQKVTIASGIGTLDKTITCVIVGGTAPYIFVSSGSSITCYSTGISGNAISGITTHANIITGLPSTVGGLVATYDSAGTTTDFQHTAGTTGIIHLLVDMGSLVNVYALDINTSNATVPKSVVTPLSISTGFTSPNYNFNMVLRKGGSTAKHVLLGSGSSTDGWRLYESTYVSDTTAKTPNVLTHPSGTWYTTTQSYNGTVWTAGQKGVAADQSANYTPVPNPSSGHGWHITGVGGFTIPTGTWNINDLTLTLDNWGQLSSNTTIQAQFWVYEDTGSAKTLINSFATSAHTFGSSTNGTTTFNESSGSFTGFTLGASSTLYVEMALYTPTDLKDSVVGSVNQVFNFTVSNFTLSFPTPAAQNNKYTASSPQAPSLTASAAGAAMCVSDTTTNPGVDLFIVDGVNVKSMNRSSAGSLSPIATLATNATAGTGPKVTNNTASGDEAVIYHGGTNQIWVVKRISGAWGSGARLDSSATADQQFAIAADRGAYQQIGAAVAYVNGTGPFNSQYEDGNFLTGITTPSPPIVSLVDSPGKSDAFGVISPYVVTSLEPWFRSIYTQASTNDPLGALRLLVQDQTVPLTAPTVAQVGTAGSTRYDYKITFVMPAGEGLVGPNGFATNGPAAITTSNYLHLTGIATGPSDCTARKVYRSTSSGTYGLVATIADNTTTILDDKSATQGAAPPSTAPTTWDSTLTGVTNGPVSGGTYDVQFNHFGTAAVTALATGHTYSVGAFASDVIAGNTSTISSPLTTFAYHPAPTATSLTPITITTATPAVTVVGTQSEGVAIGSYQVQWMAPDGVIDYDTGLVGGTWASGSTITLTPAPNFAGFFRFNQAAYTVLVTLGTSPSSGPFWQGATTLSQSVALPTPLAPTSASAVWSKGIGPTSGGSIDLTWTAPIVAGGTSSPATALFFQRETGDPTWLYAGYIGAAPPANAQSVVATYDTTIIPVDSSIAMPTAGGTPQTVHFYGVKDYGTFDVGVMHVDANGMVGGMSSITGISALFKTGIWINNASNPDEKLELGRIQSGNAFHEWTHQSKQTWSETWDRPALILSVGSLDYIETSTEVGFTCEKGYEDATYQLLKQWKTDGTTVVIRDWRGIVVFAAILSLRLGSGVSHKISTVYATFRQQDVSEQEFFAFKKNATTVPTSTPVVFTPTPYDTAVLADSPLIYYRLNDVSGTVAPNLGSTGSGNNGTYSNVTLYQTSGLGVPDASVGLSGILGSHVASSAPTGLGSTAAFTLEAIVKANNYKVSGSSLEYIIGGNNGHALGFVPEVNGGANSKEFFFNGNAAFASSLFSSASFPSATPGWHQVAYTWSGGTTTTGTESLYVDGSLAATRTGTVGTPLPYTPTFNTAFYIGENQNDSAFSSNLQGNVDEVSVYGTALTLDRIAAHYVAANLTTAPVNASRQYPDVTSALGLGLIDDASSFVTTDYSGISYVFAENKTPPLPSGIFGDKYWPWSQSYYSTNSNPYDLTWLKANHPDWLLYKTSTQADANLAWYFNNSSGHPPTIDMTNTTVQQWVVDTLWRPALASGWKGIAIDDNMSINVFGNQSTDGSNALGHFTGGGTWVPLGYSGNWMDKAWATAQKNALAAMINYLHNSAGTGVAYPNAPVMINNGFHNNLSYHVDGGATDAVIYDQVNYIPEVAGLMGEGLLNDGSGPGSRVTTATHGVLSNPWLYEVSKSELKARTGMFMFLGKAPYTVTANMTDTNALQSSSTFPRDDLNWSLANFFLMKGPHSYFYWAGSGQYTQKIGQITQAEYTLANSIGTPIETYHTHPTVTQVYMRTFTNGVVYVNPDPTNSATITLPVNTYKDLRGATQGTSLVLPAATGAVLIHV